MSGQTESQHFFRGGDSVRSIDGVDGAVVEASALFAVIEWSDGRRQELDQFDPYVVVLHRAEPT